MLWDEDLDDSDLREQTARYLPRSVVWTTDWTTGSLLDQIERDLFDLEPPFQRRTVWSDRRASLYIESLLLGCPVPAITLAEMPPDSDHQYVVIDGKQRLTSLKRFALDVDLRLTGLDVLQKFAGSSYSDVAQEPEFDRFLNLPIRTVIVRSWERDEVLHFMFHRLNSQVTPLSSHELRRSLIPGPFTSYLDRRSARSSQLHRILNVTEPDRRLRDAELLLRGLAFLAYLPEYRGNLKSFLDQVTRSLNSSWDGDAEVQVEQLAKTLEATVDAVYKIFENDSFQRWHDGAPVGRFNRAVFDTLTVSLADPDVRALAVDNRREVSAAFKELFDDPQVSPYFEATTKTRAAVFGRLSEWTKSLEEVIGRPVSVPTAPTAG